MIAAAGLGAGVYQATGSLESAIAAGAAEAFMDIDHVIEHVLTSHRPFCLKTFLARYNTLDWPRMVFLLHSYECILLLGALAWYLSWRWLWAAALGVAIHVIMDEIGNRLPSAPARMAPWFYFFSFRLRHGFRTEAFLWPDKEFYESEYYREAVRATHRLRTPRHLGEVKT